MRTRSSVQTCWMKLIHQPLSRRRYRFLRLNKDGSFEVCPRSIQRSDVVFLPPHLNDHIDAPYLKISLKSLTRDHMACLELSISIGFNLLLNPTGTILTCERKRKPTVVLIYHCISYSKANIWLENVYFNGTAQISVATFPTTYWIHHFGMNHLN